MKAVSQTIKKYWLKIQKGLLKQVHLCFYLNSPVIQILMKKEMSSKVINSSFQERK